MHLFEGSHLNPFHIGGGGFTHANWPAYPFEGAEGLLFRCSAFGPDVRLMMVDDIDQAILFAVEVPCAKRSRFKDKSKQDPYFYVAGNHSDLLVLQSKGLIDGVQPSTLGEWDRDRRDILLREIRRQAEAKGLRLSPEDTNPRLFVVIDGEQVELRLPEVMQDEEDEFAIRDWAVLPDRAVTVTETGRQLIHDLLGDRASVWMPFLSEKVRKIFEIGYYDACIREACFDLEWSIKCRLNTTAYGEQLVNDFMESVTVRDAHPEIRRRTLHQDLRAIFKLIRNRFAHVLTDIDETGAMVNLARIAWIRNELLGTEGA